MKKIYLFLLFIIAVTHLSAQNRTLKGIVVDKETGIPLAGVSIRSDELGTGVQSDSIGAFSLSVPAHKAALSISHVGYNAMKLTVEANQSYLKIELMPAIGTLNEVMVTALGVRRSRNEIPYAAQQVSGDDINRARTGNLLTGMSGKVSGLEIRQNNSMGGSVNVVLRGVKSITGNNQALFVIDGVPVDNANLNSSDQQTARGGFDYGNPVSDINPNDIASITVLKGAAATALYGSRGSNGVILITTKKGSGGLGVTVNLGVSIGNYDKTTFPKYQHGYGAGYGPVYEDTSGYFLFRDPSLGFSTNPDGVTGSLVVPMQEDASYGGPFNPNLNVYQWDAFDPTSPNYHKQTPWIAAQHGPSYFFRTAVSDNQNVLVTYGDDKNSFKLGYARNRDEGIIPNSSIDKNAVNFGATYSITSNLVAGANINYTKTAGHGRYGTGYDNNNLMAPFRDWFQINVDLKEQEAAYRRSGGQNVSWNLADPTDPNPIYWDNPYFTRYENYEHDTRNRYIGNINLTYRPFGWLNIMGRISQDHYDQLQEERQAMGSVSTSFYGRTNLSFTETNYDLLVNFDKNVTSDLNIKALLGGNIRKQNSDAINATTNGGLVVPRLYVLNNSVSLPLPPSETRLRKEVDGIFAGATLSWKSLVTLDGTIRRDVASTLPDNNNDYYYPSVSLGFTFSNLLKNVSWLSYGKLRANYAQVGSDAPFYSVYDTYTIVSPLGDLLQASVADVQNNSELKPERTKSEEIGLELSFLKDRLGLDVTYYHTKTVDQILPVALSTSTGYLSKFLNSGTILNKGVEISLHVSPIATNNFSWRIQANWSHNSNKVLRLFKDASGLEAQNLQLARFQRGVTANATLGESYGTIWGTNFVYTNGQKTVDENGRYLFSSIEPIGNINPDWIGGVTNSFRYKNFSLSALLDMRQGGKVYSTDMALGLASGLYPQTAGLNDLGNPSRNTLAHGGGVIMPGVTQDGKPNTIRVDNSHWGTFGYAYVPQAAFIYDASFIKLREVTLGYSLPDAIVRKIGAIKGINISLIGRNLWIIHKNLPFSDPEEGISFGNFQGYQVGAYPATRTFAFNLNVNF